MNQCCFIWTRGAWSTKKTGEASTHYGPEVAKFCPQCASEIEEKKDNEDLKTDPA